MKKLIFILLLGAFVIAGSGCEVSGAKNRQTAMNEYNEIISEYNHLTRSVTAFAKHVHTVLGEEAKNAVTDDAFWEKYDSLKEKVEEKIHSFESYEIKNIENRKIEEKTDPFIEQATEYLKIKEKIEEDLAAAKEAHKEQYHSLILLSNEATLEFDVIYHAILDSE